MKIFTVVGARPQFIKAAAFSREISRHKNIQEIILHTGQHFDRNMSAIFFEEMGIPKPHYNLDINCLGHGAMTGRMLEGIEELLLKEKPDIVLVYGDTNSTIAGALAAKKLQLKVAHVEAGLRSFTIGMPEEINRILTDRISDYLFCPTQNAVNNLINEGFKDIDCQIIKCGDVMLDAAKFYATMSKQKSIINEKISAEKFILCTIHRAENTDDSLRLTNIISALNDIQSSISIVLPLHPRTKKKITELGLDIKVNVIDPIGYFDIIELLQRCSFVITDSGGLQKEAFFFKKYCITLRDQTEWVELVENNVNVLVGANKKRILDQVNNIMNKQADFSLALYGDGNACKVIADELLSKY